jgi:zinc transporter ZupT
MPANILSPIQRQSSLRQLRMNLLPSLFIWLGAGLGWGVRELLSNDLIWGVILIVISTVFFWGMITNIIDRMRSNDWREVREVLTAFLAGYKIGAFQHKEKKKL